MPIPCFVNGQCIDIEVTPLGELMVSTVISPTGSVACGPDGMYVEVAGLTGDDVTPGAVAADVCGQSLARLGTGELFAYPEGGVGVSYGSDPLGVRTIPTIYANHETHNISRTWTVPIINPFDCPAWCFYTINEMRIVGEKIGATLDDPMYMTGYGTITVPGNLMAGTVNRQDQHGMWPGTVESNEHFHGWNMHALFPIDCDTVNLVNQITIEKTFHFSMDTGSGGVSMAHAAAIFVRQDSLPVRNFFPC